MSKRKIATFTTMTGYRQNFEICLNDIWQHYISEQEKAFPDCPFDDEEKDINEFDDKLLQEIAWDYILKNPDKYRVGEPDLDNEDILDWNVFDEVKK